VRKSKKSRSSFSRGREDAAEAFEASEKPLDFVMREAHGLIVLPEIEAIAFGRNYRDKTEIQGQ